MTATIRLTAAQAMVRYLSAQLAQPGLPFFAGTWAIFGHGNVAGMGEALWGVRETFPTFRSHNEQAMAHAAIAFAKASRRRRAMVCTTSIGPGALNMVTAAGVAHVNRLPVLFVPGDVFAGRRPDPVLQQVEDFGDGTVTANDAFRPVSRYFDRIARPEQLLVALPRAMAVLTDPADCGPVTLGFCQDTQAEAWDWPVSFFAPRVWPQRRLRPDLGELAAAADALRGAKAPLIVAGGGVHYAGATDALRAFAETHAIPVAETQAGKSALPWDHPLNLGSIGVTGSSSANALAERADAVLAVGTRLQDFTTGSWGLFKNPARRVIGLNVAAYDAGKRGALPLVADAREGLSELSAALGAWRGTGADAAERGQWRATVDHVTAPPAAGNALPSDSQVIGAVQRMFGPGITMVGAAGSMPGELHKLWRSAAPGGYHIEYGFSCMGYEIAGAIGVKMADPAAEVVVMLGDGSYLMMNSEIATSVMLGIKLTIVVTDNRGFGCINRLQRATGGESFNNLLADARHETLPQIDFAAHAAALGAVAEKVEGIAALEEALARARTAPRTAVVVIDTDPMPTTTEGGTWWEVAVPEVSVRPQVAAARERYETALAAREDLL
jgi:3D-(3,5/4)-trihydroxycyclohexane-1,2-dione acylhydrolase (decyclizing)